MMKKLDYRDKIVVVSDLMDGRLKGDAFADAVGLLSIDSGAREAWHVNHLVGDILRFGPAAASMADGLFVDRFQDRMKVAQVMTWPHVTALDAAAAPSGELQHYRGVDSANASNFRWKLLAGMASVAAFAAIGWTVLVNYGAPGSAPQLAQIGGPSANSLSATAGAAGTVAAGITSVAEVQVMIRDPHLDALLAAHKQFGGTSALQMPAGFLRNATFESQSR